MEDDPRVAELARLLDLAPHPEGGRYRELYRSAAITTIAFLLGPGGTSRWHRVMSDEVWNFYEGDPLVLWTIDGGASDVTRTVIGPDHRRMHVVPAGAWQAAQAPGRYSYVGCDVAPAFEFANFTLLADVPEADVVAVMALVRRHPELAGLL
jgi:uncharacterized protein